SCHQSAVRAVTSSQTGLVRAVDMACMVSTACSRRACRSRGEGAVQRRAYSRAARGAASRRPLHVVMDRGVQGFHFRPPLDTTMRPPSAGRLRATLPVVLWYLALPCMARPWLGGCAEQREASGAVPSDDVPAPVASARDAD